MSKNQKFEQLNEIQIAEIREIFTLFDKNSDGYVNTHELGNVVRALNMNPTQGDVKEMEKDVDPHDTGSFDQMNLISLIARRPKQVDDLEEMISAIKTIASSGQDASETEKTTKLSIETFKFAMATMGEKMQEHEIEEVLADCVDLIHEDNVLIDVFCNYLMSR